MHYQNNKERNFKMSSERYQNLFEKNKNENIKNGPKQYKNSSEN